MEIEQELFINKRYLGEYAGSAALYYNNKGVLKRYIPSKFTKKIVDEDLLWCRLADLPEELQVKLYHMANTLEDIMYQKTHIKDVYDTNKVKVYISRETELLQVVNKILPSDGTHAYTVVWKDDKLDLKPIVVCWNCHWSDLFSGNSEFGDNVFCLASDLPTMQREAFKEDIITLEQVPELIHLEKPKVHTIQKQKPKPKQDKSNSTKSRRAKKNGIK